jgi:hypothetical protein
VPAALAGRRSPAPPARAEFRDGQIYRWTRFLILTSDRQLIAGSLVDRRRRDPGDAREDLRTRRGQLSRLLRPERNSAQPPWLTETFSARPRASSRPLLLRGGRLVKTLSGGHRPPLGLPTGQPAYAKRPSSRASCSPFCTDGVTEARNPDGDFFGEARLVDFLRREAVAGHPPPEAVRRRIHAVINHQQDDLRDDATILLALWAPLSRPSQPAAVTAHARTRTARRAHGCTIRVSG